jgi:hypothetical protein
MNQDTEQLNLDVSFGSTRKTHATDVWLVPYHVDSCRVYEYSYGEALGQLRLERLCFS